MVRLFDGIFIFGKISRMSSSCDNVDSFEFDVAEPEAKSSEASISEILLLYIILNQGNVTWKNLGVLVGQVILGFDRVLSV